MSDDPSIASRFAAPRIVVLAALRIARIALVSYLGTFLIISFLQGQFIFPGAATQGCRSALLVAPADCQLLHLATTSHDTIAALFGPALTSTGQPYPDASSQPTVLCFYGNDNSLADCLGEFHRLRRSGLNVLIPEYIGYGMSTGRATEAGIYLTATAAYQHLLARSDIDPRKIVLIGWSLGGAAAIDLASRQPVAGLVTVSTFASVTNLAQRRFPYFPTSFLLKYRFDNAAKLPTVRCPILLIHGQHDHYVPPSVAAKLAELARAPVTRVDLPAGHADVFEAAGPVLWKSISTFIHTLTPTPIAPMAARLSQMPNTDPRYN